MNKSQLIEALAKKENLALKKAEEVVNTVFGDVETALTRGERVEIRGLGSFKVKHYRAAHKQPQARIEHPLAADVSGQKILLVDDVSDSGDTFDVAIEHINDSAQPAEIS